MQVFVYLLFACFHFSTSYRWSRITDIAFGFLAVDVHLPLATHVLLQLWRDGLQTHTQARMKTHSKAQTRPLAAITCRHSHTEAAKHKHTAEAKLNVLCTEYTCSEDVDRQAISQDKE